MTAVVDQTGGSLTSRDKLVTLTLPPGAVSGPTEISIQEITNLAPGGVGSAYLLGPEGTTFPTPVQIAMKASLATTSLDGLTIAFQEKGQGYWIRLMDVARDAAAETLTASTTHFSGWSIVAGSPRDLTGTFTFETTLDVPFTATGSSTFGFAGSDADASYYLQSGTITIGTISYGAGVTCVAPAPVLSLFTNVAELTTAPVEFRWGFSGHWNIACTPPQSTPDVTAAFDTAGINLIHCSRGYVGVPIAGPDRMSGTYRIDCGSGAETASWDFRTAGCGTSCAGQPDALCHAGVLDCSTGTSVCVNGAALGNGTSCGTDQVCNGGACVACTAACPAAVSPIRCATPG